ncbi:MAG TPA: shikimate kinase [Gemmataceae bacterium]|nr:shikimate kinase [Gemmataceae bacterium]
MLMNISDERVFLVGYRGTGKSSVARLLAHHLGWQWVDADEILEQRAGMTIRQVFEAEGETGFRKRESLLLEELCELRRTVIATGGGVVLSGLNRQRLKAAGRVVWLTADPPTIRHRLEKDKSTAERRPALTVGGLAEIKELLRAREPLYRAVADLTVDTTGRAPEEVADTIHKSLNQG